MGDSSWVIMAGDPGAALWIHAVLLATGLLTGHAVDALGLSPRLREDAAHLAGPVPTGPARSLGAAAPPQTGLLTATGLSATALLGTAALAALLLLTRRRHPPASRARRRAA